MSPSRVLETAIEGAWDTHHHIFDPRFSYAPDRHLTPPAAPLAAYQQFRAQQALSRSVLVHGLSYGHDCTSLKAFLKDLGPESRGVAVINRQTTDDEIDALHAAGVRGIRLDLYLEGCMRDLDKQREMLVFYAGRIRRLGWSMAFLQLEPRNWQPLSDLIPQLSVPIVVDHHALMRAQSMRAESEAGSVLQQEGMSAIVEMLRHGAGNFWIKLSAPYRCSNDGADFGDMREIVRCLVDANPRRVVWGSDWPHTPRMKVRSREEALVETPYLEVDDQAWLASLRRWLSDEEWQLLMVENPTTLYGW